MEQYERYEHRPGGMAYPQASPCRPGEDDWFDVDGDLDDFIFYDGSGWPSDEDEDGGHVSRR